MAVRFDAASDRVSFAGTLPDPSAGFTLTAWALVAVSTGTFATMARLHNPGTVITCATGGSGLTGPGYYTTGGSVENALGFAVGAWRQVAISCTGTTGRICVAAPGGPTEVDTGTVSDTTAPTGITLGGRGPADAAEWWNGRLAHVRLWAVELTLAQIEAEWASPTPVVTGGLWADWPLSTAADLTDHSGNGRHLTAGSTAVTTEDGPPLPTTTRPEPGRFLLAV